MYVTIGWVRLYSEGEGEHLLRAGNFIYHPKGRMHDFMDYSRDIDILKMASPAHHHSIDL